MNYNSVKPNSYRGRFLVPFKMLVKVALFLGFLFTPSGVSPLTAQSLQEIRQLKQEYERARELQKAGFMPDTSLKNYGLPIRILYKSRDLDQYYRTRLTQLKSEFESLKHEFASIDSTKKLVFNGYEFFTSRDTIPFWQNLPLPDDYLLGPGDEVILSLWGEVERFDRKTIGREGAIYLDDIGQINLSGKTLGAARAYMKERLSRIYATLKGTNSSTYMDLSLGNLKGLNVRFVGHVKFPGVYVVHPFSTVITGLIQAGGVDTTGSLREIKVYRQGKQIGTIDLYTFLNSGQPTGDLRLRDQDVIFVPARHSTVAINGAIFKPGYYEMISSETLADLVAYAGTLKPDAGSFANLKRIIPLAERDSDDEALLKKRIQIDDLGEFPAQNGDSLVIPKIFPTDNYVTVYGQVKYPGEYPLIDSLRLSQLLSMAGGLQDTNWLKTVNLDQAQLLRWDEQTGNRVKIEINLAQLLQGNSQEDIRLKAFDQLSIYKNPAYGFDELVTITGQVKIPGSYPIMGRTLESILAEAGGLTAGAFKDGVEIYRDTIKVGWHSFQFIPVGGDSIYVPPRPGTVKIEGAVNRPGYLTFKDERRLKDYLRLAGGLTAYADKRKIILIYPNGEAIPKERFSNPRVPEGSTIVVSEGKTINQQNYLDIVQRLASIAGSLATLLLVVRSTP